MSEPASNADPATRQRLADNWNAVVREVREAAAACDRDPDSIRIIGVTKYVDAETTLAVFESGCWDLAENRPQSLWQKAESLELPDTARWHLIGHLQRNKVRRTLRQRPMIHSIDSERLLRAIAREAAEQGVSVDVLLEVNISGDAAKTGLSSEQVAGLLEEEMDPRINLLGLMAMAGWGTTAEDARDQFAAVRRLRDRCQDRTGRPLPHLSMGMSGDFREAIAEGATMVRIGSRLYEGILQR
jgi:hypothetical protein